MHDLRGCFTSWPRFDSTPYLFLDLSSIFLLSWNLRGGTYGSLAVTPLDTDQVQTCLPLVRWWSHVSFRPHHRRIALPLVTKGKKTKTLLGRGEFMAWYVDDLMPYFELSLDNWGGWQKQNTWLVRGKAPESSNEDCQWQATRSRVGIVQILERVELLATQWSSMLEDSTQAKKREKYSI